MKRDQKDRKQDHQRYSSGARPFRFLQQVGNGGAEKEYLDGSHQSCGDFHQGKLVNERVKKNRATRHGSGQAQGYRKDKTAVCFLHFYARALCSHFVKSLRSDGALAPESYFIVAEDAIPEAR
jgi:hypothetical protein